MIAQIPVLASPLSAPPRWAGLALAFCVWLAAGAVEQDAPTLNVDETCTAFAYAPDGRIAYSVRHILTTRQLEIQRDDIWLIGLDGKRRRIVNGEKLIQGASRSKGPAAFSYAIQSMRWSPEGTRLTVEMLTSEMIDPRGDTREGQLTLLLDDTGREIRIAGADSVIPEATNAAWLADGVTVVYLQEAVKPKLLYSIHTLRPVAGRGGALFADHVFAAAAWNAKQNIGVAIERERSLSGPPRLVALDLLKETHRELATLDGFQGGLSLSPSGSKSRLLPRQRSAGDPRAGRPRARRPRACGLRRLPVGARRAAHPSQTWARTPFGRPGVARRAFPRCGKRKAWKPFASARGGAAARAPRAQLPRLRAFA